MGRSRDDEANQNQLDPGVTMFFVIASYSARTANVRSQAEKRLETQRKNLTENWKG